MKPQPPSLAAARRVPDTRYSCEVIAPAGVRERNDEWPSDPEVFYFHVEETSKHTSDGRRVESVIAKSERARRRFAVTAKKLGFEVPYCGNP